MDTHERLEVEDEDKRQKRLSAGCFTTLGNDETHKFVGQLLMRVDQAGHNTLNTAGSSMVAPIDPTAGGPTPVPVEPPVERTSSRLNALEHRRMTEFSVLDRVRQFLPQLAESNASLSSRGQHELDIENIGDDSSYYIEMVHRIPVSASALAYFPQNLGLGVFEEAHSGEGASASSSSSSMSEHDGEDSDSSSSGSSSCLEQGVEVALRPKKPLPKRATPSITILNESENPPGGSSA